MDNDVTSPNFTSTHQNKPKNYIPKNKELGVMSTMLLGIKMHKFHHTISVTIKDNNQRLFSSFLLT